MSRAYWKHVKETKVKATLFFTVAYGGIKWHRLWFTWNFFLLYVYPWWAGNWSKSFPLEKLCKMWNLLMSNWNQHIISPSLNWLREDRNETKDGWNYHWWCRINMHEVDVQERSCSLRIRVYKYFVNEVMEEGLLDNSSSGALRNHHGFSAIHCDVKWWIQSTGSLSVVISHQSRKYVITDKYRTELNHQLAYCIHPAHAHSQNALTTCSK